MIRIFVEGRDSEFLDKYLLFLFGENKGMWEIIQAGGYSKLHLLDQQFKENTERGGVNLIIFDADLQDDLNAIEEMIDAYTAGYDVVYGVKVSRQADPLLKRLSATAFYKLQRRMGVESIYNHADFRFLSRRVLEQLSHYQERNLYLRGIIPLLGFPSTTVDDVIRERTAGSSKYTLRKMLGLALDGITSFSVKPIYGIVYLGIIFVFISILIGFYVLYSLIAGTAEHGWASLMLSVWFVGGVVLMSIGAVGLYIGKIYKEVKHRPLYNVEEVLCDEDKQSH